MPTLQSAIPFYPLTVAWCGSDVPRSVNESDLWSIQRCTADALQASCAELIVLESAAFERLDSCYRACRNLKAPVLLIVRPDDVGEVIPWLAEKDEVCVSDVPPELVVHRIQRLADSQGRRIDSLTGVFTRAHLVNVLRNGTDGVCPQNPVSLILADLDQFKAFNDRHGHAVGDHALTQCGAVLRSLTGPEELAARCGGQEFAILARKDADGAFELAERIRQEIADQPVNDGQALTVSVGVATVTDPKDMASLFPRTDEALYAAKARGRNVTVSYREIESASFQSGEDVEVTGLENRARVLSERVANHITRRSKRLLKSVRAEAETDGLTQCYTRRYFDRRLETEFDQVVRGAGTLSVGLIDVDFFGRVNKEHGWPTGDKILRGVADVLRSNVRETDWIGRYGGEEFCVVMPHTSLEDSCAVLERVRVAVEEARFTSTSGTLVPVTVSIGVVACTTADDDPSALIERASTQTLSAKRAGRNCLRAEADVSDHSPAIS